MKFQEYAYLLEQEMYDKIFLTLAIWYEKVTIFL